MSILKRHIGYLKAGFSRLAIQRCLVRMEEERLAAAAREETAE